MESRESTDEFENSPNCTSSAVFLFTVLSSATVMFAVSPWLANHVSLKPFFIYESVLYIAALLSMCVLVFWIKKDNNEATDSTGTASINISNQNEQMSWYHWTNIPMRGFFLLLCGLGALVLPSVEIYMAIYNMSCLKDHAWKVKEMFRLKCASNGLCGFYCLFQLIFIFKRMKYISKNVVSLILMSVVISANFTLFVNTVVSSVWAKNTKSMDLEHRLGITFPNITNFFIECYNYSTDDGKVETYDKVYQYTYQFPVEFALLSLCFLLPMWNIFFANGSNMHLSEQSESLVNTNDRRNYSSSVPFETDETKNTVRRWLKIPKKTGAFLSTHAFVPSLIVASSFFTAHAYLEYHKDGNETSFSYSGVQTGYTYVLNIVTGIAFFFTISLKIHRTDMNSNDFVFLVAIAGHLFLILFETLIFLEGITGANGISFVVKTAFHYVGIFSQILLILKLRKVRLNRHSLKDGRQLFLKGLVVLVGVCNFGKWLGDVIFQPSVLKFVHDVHRKDLDIQIKWWFITEVLMPFVTLSRLMTAIMCFAGCVRFKIEGNRYM